MACTRFQPSSTRVRFSPGVRNRAFFQTTLPRAFRQRNRFTFPPIAGHDKSITPHGRGNAVCQDPVLDYLSADVSICNRKYLHLLCDSRPRITSGGRRPRTGGVQSRRINHRRFDSRSHCRTSSVRSTSRRFRSGVASSRIVCVAYATLIGKRNPLLVARDFGRALENKQW